jgi:hypothetical protein
VTPRKVVWGLAKLLQGAGLLVVLVGLFGSISLGLEDQGLSSMTHELNGLMWGGLLFATGWILERAARGR